jgi:hypothetical protein
VASILHTRSNKYGSNPEAPSVQRQAKISSQQLQEQATSRRRQQAKKQEVKF